MNPNTAKDWKRACLANEDEFLSGPHYCHAGNAKFSDRERKHMTRYMEEQDVSARDAAEELSESRDTGGKWVSRTTLCRLARKAELHPYIPQKKPDLTAQHKRERFAFAKNHRDTEFASWNFNDQFKVKCPLRYAVKRSWKRKRSDVKPMPTRKFPPVLDVHASITRMRTLPLIFFEGKMNSVKFEEINDELIPQLCAAFLRP